MRKAKLVANHVLKAFIAMLTPPHIKAINVPKAITVQKLRPDLIITHVNQVRTTPSSRATRH